MVLLLALIGATYETIARAVDARNKHPPLGKLVDVGGYRLHINCLGEGSPVVVMDSGLGDSMLAWSLVQPEIAQTTRVCAYDRAGLGWSDPGPTPRTSQRMVSELHRLLEKAGIEGPYVLVGHSFGGYNVRLYANRYPEEVVGMVLVDPSQSAHVSKTTQVDPMPVIAAVLKVIYRLGIPRAIRELRSEHGAGTKLPEEMQAMDRALSYDGALAEISGLNKSEAQIRDAGGSLGDMPLVVLVAYHRIPEGLATLSSNSTLTVVEGSGHYIQLDVPQLVVDAVHQVVEEALNQ